MADQNSNKPKLSVPSEAQDIFDWWNKKASFTPNDSFRTKLYKIAVRLLGIILLIIFSPILLAIFIMVVAISL